MELKRNRKIESQIPLFYILNWYFFSVSVFFFFGKVFVSKLANYVV